MSEPSWGWLISPSITLVGVIFGVSMLNASLQRFTQDLRQIALDIKSLQDTTFQHSQRLVRIETTCKLKHDD